MTPGPDLDLALEREIGLPVAPLWACWTRPELLRQWFCPLPWRVTEAEIDLRPGGVFSTLMRGPQGEEHPNPGCFLDIVPERRLVFTDAMQPGFRPARQAFMTGVVGFEPDGDRTRYRAAALHATAEARAKHEAMGFHQGRGQATDQPVALARSLRP